MNRIETTHNGGFPLVLDDYRFEHAAIAEAIKGVMSPYGVDTAAQSFVVVGCEFTGTLPEVYAAGWICYKGEIVKCDGGTVPTPAVGQIVYWAIQETFDPSGSKSFQNQTTNNVYVIRRAVLVVGPAPVDYMPKIAARLDTLMYNRLNALGLFANRLQEAWREVGTVGNPPFDVPSGWINATGHGPACAFYKDHMGIVHIRGAVRDGTLSLGAVIFILPTSYRPDTGRIIYLPAYDASSTSVINWIRVQIETDGRIITHSYAASSPTITTPILHLGEIAFRAAT